jgi:uncharacterized protein
MSLHRKIFVLLTALLLVLAPITLMAREGDLTPPIPLAQISSEGLVKAVPDLALFNFTIHAEATTAQSASSQNAQKADAFLKAVKKFLHEGDTVKSTGYRIVPLYTYGDKGKKPAITGYRASNGFQVRIKELARLGDLIDLATQHGVNDIQGPVWQHSGIDNLVQEASVQALQQAKQMAAALAGSQGMKIKRLQKVSTGARVMPYPREMKAMVPGGAAESVATPIEVGEQEIRATVEAVFELE